MSSTVITAIGVLGGVIGIVGGVTKGISWLYRKSKAKDGLPFMLTALTVTCLLTLLVLVSALALL